nr:uncharacterized protein LOC110081519 isoform X2 [Pogona vitticeps]
MALGASNGTFRVFLLIASFYHILANRIKDQAQFKWLEKFHAESVKEWQLHPDVVIILQKRSEAPFGFYMTQAVQESNDLKCMILSDLQPISPEMLAWQKKKHQIPNKTDRNSFKKRKAEFFEFVRRAEPRPIYRQLSAVRKLVKSQRTLLKRLKRSLFRSRTNENNLEETYLSNMLKTKEQKTIDSRYTRKFPEKREAEAADTLSGHTVHFTITALQTQERLSEMVDRLSDPSNSMPKEERLAYMRELLNELNMLMKLLQKRIQLQSPNETSTLTTTFPPAA